MTRLSIILAVFWNAGVALAGDPPANADMALKESFDRDKLGKGWKINTGEWKVVKGALRGKELAAQKHSAAIRRVLASQNAVYELKFRFINKAKAFHFGFDPARGELKKKGHLFSVIITPNSWKILKHVDKNRRKQDPNKVLAQKKVKFTSGKWHTLRVTTWDKYVTARIDDNRPLKAEHDTFRVKKPTLVFRCLGDGVEIDDVRVWTQKK